MPFAPTALRPRVFVAALAAVVALLGAAEASAGVVLTDTGPGAIARLSADGSAGAGLDNDSYQAYRWTLAGGHQDLGRNPYMKLGTGGGVPQISADGSVVASTILDDTRTHATEGRWTVAGGWQQLAPPLPPDGGVMDLNDSDVFGLSGDGQVVTGLYWRPGQPGGSAHGSVWTAATGMIGLATQGGSSRVDGASYDGHVLCGWEESPTTGERRATLWIHGVRTFLDANGADGHPGECARVNSAGTVAVGNSWDEATMRTTAAIWRWNASTSAWDRTLVGILPGGTATAASYAFGVSDDGNVVVGMDRDKYNKFTSRGWVWTPSSGMVDVVQWLKTQGVSLAGKFDVSQMSDVSADGKVMAMIGSMHNPPYTQRTLLIHVTE